MVTAYEKLQDEYGNITQKGIVYLELKESDKPIHFSAITSKGIPGYTERISELRKLGFNIVNVTREFYKIDGEPNPTINDLKIMWIHAKKLGYPNVMRKAENATQRIQEGKEAISNIMKGINA